MQRESGGYHAALSIGGSLVLAAIGLSTISAAIVFVIWLFGGLQTSGDFVDWNVVTALATLAAALAASGALVALAFNLRELDAGRREERLSRQPYLRVDVGFEERIAYSTGFSPPSSNVVFEVKDFGDQANAEGLAPLAPAPGELSFGLLLWVTNKQQSPLGFAYGISLQLIVGWPDERGEPTSTEVSVHFAYVEPGKTTAIRLARVRRRIPWLVAVVVAVSYQDAFQGQPLFDRHGALEMYYDEVQGVASHGRKFRLGKDRRA